MNALKKLLPTRLMAGLRYIRHGRLSWDRTLPSADLSSAMTTKEEQALFTKSVRDVAKLQGQVIDLGCWLGSTTISLASGLRDLNDSGKVYAFDRFTWEPWMDLYSSEHWCDYLPGESFLPETRRRMGDLKPWVVLVAADLTTYHWDNGPVRLLLVDAMKSWRLTTSIAREFYPSLVVGSIVLHQDYLSYNHPWLSVLQYRLRDYMRYDTCVSHGCTATFKLIQQIPPDVLTAAINFSLLSDDEAERSWLWSLAVIGERARGTMACSKIMYHLGKGDIERSKRLLSESGNEHIEPHNLLTVQQDIAKAESGDHSWAEMNADR
ncbi:MAG: class I SAM-dependent methyltransferase [Prosthecobacter sp.]|uniref:class I SAM-dependent methyltransferase n=1 Tax=Prosthecobacter sp. TaxID=1965333 RepID=UPI0025D06F10|nr:class I SAM-dependent methyltransferase [Prosthecobacter sp.]MCF7787345.1 class I SAM-dependent methyltransferase [Prosthecobacter sp.]